MSKYVAEFTFGTETDADTARAWFTTILDAMPPGTEATLRQAPLVLDLKKLTEEHAGNLVKFYSPKLKGTIEGTLEHVFLSGRDDESRTLIVDGKAHDLTYAVIQLGEW